MRLKSKSYFVILFCFKMTSYELIWLILGCQNCYSAVKGTTVTENATGVTQMSLIRVLNSIGSCFFKFIALILRKIFKAMKCPQILTWALFKVGVLFKKKKKYKGSYCDRENACSSSGLIALGKVCPFFLCHHLPNKNDIFHQSWMMLSFKTHERCWMH